MSNGIAHNNLNDISKIYLETISDINKKEQADDVKRWQQEDAKYGYDKQGNSLNPKDIKKRKMKEESECKKESPFKKRKNKDLPFTDDVSETKYQREAFSNWRETLTELKKSTLGSYVKKASQDLSDRRFDQGDSEKRKYDPDKADDKEDKKLDKREEGIARAAKKLSKEEFNVRSPLTFSKKEEPQVDQSELEEKYACSTKKAHKRLKK